jgi:hypothetical protein
VSLSAITFSSSIYVLLHTLFLLLLFAMMWG